MGGGHHGHEPPYKVPSYKIYTVESAPELMATQRALKGMGLKDPWLRNEVWKYHGPSHREIVTKGIFRGFKWGLLAAIITTGVGYVIGEDDHHGHHGEHKKH